MGVSGWRLHDLRRTMRSHLSALGVSQDVAELAIGHGRSGLARIYDQYTFERELRDALQRWGNKLRDLTEPPPPNVVKLPSTEKAQAHRDASTARPRLSDRGARPGAAGRVCDGLSASPARDTRGQARDGYGVGMIKAAGDWLLARYAEARTPAPAEAVHAMARGADVKPTPRGARGAACT